MADKSKNCPGCGSPMRLDRRQKPEGATTRYVGEDYWICTNEECLMVIEAAKDAPAKRTKPSR
jgi:hypothetical protein